MDYHKLTWLTTGACVLGAIGMFGFAFFGSVKPRAAANPTMDAERLRLEEFLASCKRTWRPAARKAALAEAEAMRDTYAAPLVGLLQEGDHPLLAEAIALAAALEVGEARGALVMLATDGREALRPVALRAADRMEPFDAATLSAFLAATEPVVLAALECCASRDDRPIEVIVELFGHESPAVRAAAVAAIPRELQPLAREALIRTARTVSGRGAAYAIRAMGRITPGADVDAFLLERLSVDQPAARIAALLALSQRATPFADASVVWESCLDAGRTQIERALAFACLERTRSFDADAIRAEIRMLDPYLQYSAARCLIAAGQRDGLEALLDLVHAFERSTANRDDADAQRADFAARKVLARFSGIGPYCVASAWDEWFLGLDAVDARDLPAAPIEDLAARSDW